MDENKIIHDYFEKTASDFDSIYSKRKALLRRIVDFVFRRSIKKRFELTMKECSPLGAKTVIDVGCGSGRYTVALAKRGAARVVGIDFSEQMLEIAKKLARDNKVDQICQFTKANFFTYEFQTDFDYSIAIGVAEYFKNPQDLIRKMGKITKEKIIISLPVKWSMRAALRKIRLKLKGYPVYFYTKKRVVELLESCGFYNYSIQKIDRDYFIVIRMRG